LSYNKKREERRKGGGETRREYGYQCKELE
jgi:hypothetical protein